MTVTVFVDGQHYTGKWTTGKTKKELAETFFDNADKFGTLKMTLLNGDVLVLPSSVTSHAHFVIGDE